MGVGGGGAEDLGDVRKRTRGDHQAVSLRIGRLLQAGCGQSGALLEWLLLPEPVVEPLIIIVLLRSTSQKSCRR